MCIVQHRKKKEFIPETICLYIPLTFIQRIYVVCLYGTLDVIVFTTQWDACCRFFLNNTSRLYTTHRKIPKSN